MTPVAKRLATVCNGGMLRREPDNKLTDRRPE